MRSLFLLGLVGLTSLAAYLAGTHWLALSRRGLEAVASRLLEWAGLTLVFFGINLGIGVLAIVAIRTVTGAFLPVNLLHDVALLVLSLLQALAFEWWRDQIASSPRG